MRYKKDALAFLGITKWHEAGYTGKGIKIMSDESVCEKKHSDVISPKGFNSKSGHGDDVMSHIKLVIPDAEHIAFTFGGTFTKYEYKSECAEYIKENKVHIFTTSNLGAYPSQGHQKAMQDCIEAGCIFFSACGNDGEKGVRGESKCDGYWTIGGVRPKFTGKYDGEDPIYNWNEFHKVRYSSAGPELDFVTLAEILGVAGTSFCSPVFAGMVGLVQQFFIEKIGRRLTRLEMEVFIKDNLIDVELEGFDELTGHGLFVLPEPEMIKISDYVTDMNVGDFIDYSGFPQIGGEDMKAILTIDNHIICINGEEKVYDVAPFIKDDRTFVPVQFLRDMGFDVEWNEATRQVIISK